MPRSATYEDADLGQEDGQPSADQSTSTSNIARSVKTRPPGRPLTRRKRAFAACQFCRLRKTKCDTARPSCAFCLYHDARCIYDEDTDRVNDVGLSSWTERDTIVRNDCIEEISSDVKDIKQLLLHQQQQLRSLPLNSASTHGQAASPSWSRTGEGVGTPVSTLLAVPRSTASEPLLRAARCESLLRWPIFEGIFTEADVAIQSFPLEASPEGSAVRSEGLSGIPGDAFVPLCRKFLDSVYPRNPILEKDDLISCAMQASANGLQFTASSCLVLIACSLACCTTTWSSPQQGDPTFEVPEVSPQDKLLAEAYFQAARKRIGLLGTSMLDIQCLFFACVYERYALRPKNAWLYIQMACTKLQMYLMCNGSHKHPSTSQDSSTAHSHLESRVFWSCYKAESELSLDLGLQSSGLGTLNYPDLFPEPPSMLLTSPASNNGSTSPHDPNTEDTAEKQSWLFYLAEISLRRTIDDTIWLFYHNGEDYWLTHEDLLVKRYAETSAQISQWHSHLPATISFTPPHGNSGSEFALFLHSRFLDWRETALRPLVYIFLHQPTQAPLRPAVVDGVCEALHVATEAIAINARHHRHGGTWLMTRRVFASALLILAVVIRRRPEVSGPMNWSEVMQTAIQTLQKWEAEAPDVGVMRRILQRAVERVWRASQR